MERNPRALELARGPREVRLGAVDEAQSIAIDSTSKDDTLPSLGKIGDVHDASAPSATIGTSDTTRFALPEVELDRGRRDRERILPPGASGAAGAPYKMLRTQVLKRLDQLGVNTLAVL